ncbi:hypothetical protein D3C71_1276000 [compost metagenome]
MQAQLHAIKHERAAIGRCEAVAEAAFAGGCQSEPARQAVAFPAIGNQIEDIHALPAERVQLQPALAFDAEGEGVGQLALYLRGGAAVQQHGIEQGERCDHAGGDAPRQLREVVQGDGNAEQAP